MPTPPKPNTYIADNGVPKPYDYEEEHADFEVAHGGLSAAAGTKR